LKTHTKFPIHMLIMAWKNQKAMHDATPKDERKQ
jgi:hypothetical protein